MFIQEPSRVCHGFYLGYGSEYRHLYSHKTHTLAMGMVGWGWVGSGFFHRERTSCLLSCVELALCLVNMGTLVSGDLEYDGVCEGQ